MSKAYDKYNYKNYWKGRDYEHESEILAISSFLKKLPMKTRRIADIGCGFGRLLPYYAGQAREVVLVDPSKNLLDLAKRAHMKLINERKCHAQAEIVRSTAEKLNGELSKNKADLVFCIRVMHHISDPDKLISTLSHSIEKGGYLILEFANKIHGKAVITRFIKGDITFPIDIFPEDKRCQENIRNNSIPFLNFHPDLVKESLKRHGFKIVDTRSVSNIRSRPLKKRIPLKVLVFFEKLMQKPFAKLSFGPSIFILAQKG